MLFDKNFYILPIPLTNGEISIILSIEFIFNAQKSLKKEVTV